MKSRLPIVALLLAAGCDDPPPPPPAITGPGATTASSIPNIEKLPPSSLTLRLSDSPDPSPPEGPVELRLEVINQHRVDEIFDVTLRYQLPESFEWVGSVPNAEFDAATGTWFWHQKVIPAAPNGGMVRVVTVRPRKPGWAVHRVTLEQPGEPPRTVQEATDVGGTSGLEIEAADVRDPVRAGGEAEATLTLRNTGTTALQDVAVTIEAPGSAARIEKVGALGGGSFKTLRAPVKTSEAGRLLFRFTVSGVGLPAVVEEETIHVVP